MDALSTVEAGLPHQEVACIVGAFDLFHVGHLDQLLHAAEYCDQLVVALPSDDLISSWTGDRPFVPQIERAEILTALRCVSQVELLDTFDLSRVVARVGAHLVLVGVEAQQDGSAGELSVPAGAQLIRLHSRRTTCSSAVTAALERRHKPLPGGRSKVA